MSDKLDLIEIVKEALAEGEEFDRQMEAAGWTMTRDIHLLAFLEVFASGLPEGSRFFIRGGLLFKDGELLHWNHPTMPIVVTTWSDIWLPPVHEVVDGLWGEVVEFALKQPDRFRAAVRSVQEVDLAFDTCPL